MSERLLLIGASGLAREVIAAGVVGVVGILDDDSARQGTEVAGVPVLGPVRLAVEGSDRLLVCVGPGSGRRSIVARLAEAGVREERYGIFAARSARIGHSSVVGAGSILLDSVVVTADASVGRHVVIMPNSTVTHDDVLEDFVTLAAGVSLGGGVRVGEGAYLGMNASVRQGITVGTDAVIGMGAAVIADVPDGRTWAGVPARDLGEKR
ncbi:NeuD/PglB/VioB family sugar acetyltransferase [Microbacterium capsulatum]|uniref:NeuD/PglB/VioB family sugar acetyltransferase n=1 Tax=Microbacterium capsulatum TaxID=3041921 RepID=A0ABU0XGL5_9MICO|nr:NeuD/PglB/VioB family sugar acetyltransferase [Microbacterium sp. ASV81]MDQ4214261.1 NeuD/PglB/VioB family sugar acetyltransferase [Microbacterium sp. ASV81]